MVAAYINDEQLSLVGVFDDVLVKRNVADNPVTEAAVRPVNPSIRAEHKVVDSIWVHWHPVLL